MRWCVAAKLLAWGVVLLGWNACVAVAQQGATVAAGVKQATAGAVPLAFTTLEALRQMEARAGVVFAGEVIAIRRPGIAQGDTADAGQRSLFVGNAGMVEVDIRVEDAVRGCTAGGHYVLREWAGLWVNQAPRYRVGQRAVWLLHAPNAAGMSSPVGGMVGVLPVTGRGGLTQVDLRWVRTQIARQLVVLPNSPERARILGLKTNGNETSEAWQPPVLAVAARGEPGVSGALRMEAAGASQSQDYNAMQAALENPMARYTTLLGVLYGMEAARDGAQR